MTLMHFDPFRDLERLTEQALAYGGAREPCPWRHSAAEMGS
jgi:hypothetical protein